MSLKNEFVAAWKAGTGDHALLELVHRFQAQGMSARDAYWALHELWVESGFNDSVESSPLQDNLEYVLERLWYECPAAS